MTVYFKKLNYTFRIVVFLRLCQLVQWDAQIYYTTRKGLDIGHLSLTVMATKQSWSPRLSKTETSIHHVQSNAKLAVQRPKCW